MIKYVTELERGEQIYMRDRIHTVMNPSVQDDQLENWLHIDMVSERGQVTSYAFQNSMTFQCVEAEINMTKVFRSTLQELITNLLVLFNYKKPHYPSFQWRGTLYKAYGLQLIENVMTIALDEECTYKHGTVLKLSPLDQEFMTIVFQFVLYSEIPA